LDPSPYIMAVMNNNRQMVPATFVKRLNRFVAQVAVNGKEALAHVPNSGRLRELFVSGRQALVQPVPDPLRKTPYTLKAVKYNGFWVSVDSTLPNQIIYDAVRSGVLPFFPSVRDVRREAVYGGSRFDLFVREASGRECYMEVKSVTLVKDGIAMFPDAPTERGRKHLRELIDAVKAGYRGVVIFCVQRGDAGSFSPNDETDPAFGEALREAARSGVEVHAWRCIVTDGGAPVLEREIDVRL